eukprot:tig00021036_g17324.t1
MPGNRTEESRPRVSLDHTSKRQRQSPQLPAVAPMQPGPSALTPPGVGADLLPPELLALILDYLTPEERRTNAALVCRSWAIVALDPTRSKTSDPLTLRLRLPSHWSRRDDLDQSDLMSGLERLVRVRYGGRVRTLHITRWELSGSGEQEVQIFSGALSLFPRLDRLYLYNSFKGYPKQDHILQLVSCYCPALRYLQWSVLLYNPKNMPHGVVLPTVTEVRASQVLSPAVAQDVTIQQLLEVFPGLALLKS